MTNRRWRAWVLAALGLAILAASQQLRDAPAGHILEIDLRTSAGNVAQLFWHDGDGFSEAQSITLPLERTSGTFQRLRFPLPPLNLVGVRFDPTDAPAEVVVGGMR